jgi:hypothetical protein
MTSLARQLEAIRSETVATLDKRKHEKVASLLFDPEEAADQDLDAIYSLGLNGLHGLIQLDPGFQKFAGTLFSQTSRDIDRTIQAGPCFDVTNFVDESGKRRLGCCGQRVSRLARPSRPFTRSLEIS